MQISSTPLSSCFTRRFKGRSQLAVPSILFLHQHFLHTVQPLPSSSSVYILCLTSCRLPSVFIRRPASHHCQRNYRTAPVPSLPGSYPSSSLLQTLPPPSRLPSFPRFSRL